MSPPASAPLLRQLVTTREKASMGIDSNERSNRGGAGGIIGDFLTIGKELGGKKAEIGEAPRTRRRAVRETWSSL
jgi:hypothetical protein